MTSDTAVLANDNNIEESMADHVFEIVIVSLLVRILGVNWKTYVERNRNPSENKISLTIDPYDNELKSGIRTLAAVLGWHCDYVNQEGNGIVCITIS